MQIAFAKVRTRRDFVALIDAVKKTVYDENPGAAQGYGTALDALRRVFTNKPRSQHLTLIRRTFPQVRGVAAAAGAPQTAGAVGQAEAWFASNAPGIAAADTRYTAPAAPAVVKKGARPAPRQRRTAPRPTYRPPAAPPAAPAATQGKTPITQRVWFWPTVIGGVGLLLAGGIIAASRR